MYFDPVPIKGNLTIQIGQSTGGGCLESALSCNSAARFLHAVLCSGRCAIWQSLLQYFTILHATHNLRSPLHSSPLPQLAQHIMVLSLIILIDCEDEDAHFDADDAATRKLGYDFTTATAVLMWCRISLYVWLGVGSGVWFVVCCMLQASCKSLSLY